MALQVGIAILALVMALATIHFAPGLLAGLIWSVLPIYGTSLPTGTGLIVCASGVAIIAVRCAASRDIEWKGKSVGLLLALTASLLVTARMYTDNRSFATYDLAMPLAVVISVLILFIGLSSVADFGLIRGVVLGVSIVSGAEVLRVAGGGSIHPAEAALGINPIMIGQFATLGILLALFMIRLEIARPTYTVALTVCAAGLVATNSRGPLLGLVVALLLMYVPGWFKRETESDYRLRPLTPVFAVITVVIALAATSDLLHTWLRATDQDGNAGSRLDAWSTAVKSIIDSPLVGQGAGRYNMGDFGAVSGLPEFPHNIFLEIWSEYGLVPFALLAAGVVLILTRSGVAGRPIVVAFIVCFSISGSLDTSLGLWVALAISLTLNPISEQVHRKRLPRRISGVAAGHHLGDFDPPVKCSPGQDHAENRGLS